MKVLVSFIFLFTAAIVTAQLEHPKASPAAKVDQTVGFTQFHVEYSRPAARGRTIFGNQADGQPALVPYGRIWRVGANESTKISFDSDIAVKGNHLEKGTYALYAFPQEEEWEIVFHTNTEHWGDGRKNYKPEEDALRIKVTPQVVSSFQENFLIAFDSITHNSLNLILKWAHTRLNIPISVNTHAIMQQQIEQQLSDEPTAQTYYEAARYYVEQEMNYKTALDYSNKALKLGGDTYYFHRVKSLVEAALGDFRSAITSARKSLDIAQALEKDEFVRMNRKNINLWSSKLNTEN